MASSSNILSIRGRAIAESKTDSPVIELSVSYRWSSLFGVAPCSTAFRSLPDPEHPLWLGIDQAVVFAVECSRLRPEWEGAIPTLIDFSGRVGGTVKIKLDLYTSQHGKIPHTTPWLDYMKSDYCDAINDLKEAAVEFILTDEKAPAIAGVDEGSYAD